MATLEQKGKNYGSMKSSSWKTLWLKMMHSTQ
jgi:hypothetical protein